MNKIVFLCIFHFGVHNFLLTYFPLGGQAGATSNVLSGDTVGQASWTLSALNEIARRNKSGRTNNKACPDWLAARVGVSPPQRPANHSTPLFFHRHT